MKKLAAEAMVFYATAPFTAIAMNPKSMLNLDYVNALAANKEKTAAQLAKQAAQTKSSTAKVNLTWKIKQLLFEQQALLSWADKIKPPPGPPSL
jgi:hypothetical protein